MIIQKWKKLLNRNNRVLNVSHKDLDGVASSIIIQNVFKKVDFKYLKYGEVNSYLKTVDYNDYDVVILTDISPETVEAFDISDKFFLLDHHLSAKHFHCVEKNRIVNTEQCATVLVKKFFESLHGIDLGYLNEFCSIVDDYDRWIMSDSRSWAMNELYFFYYESDFRRRFMNGNVKFSEDELDYIKKQKKALDETYKNLTIYKCDKVNMCFFLESRFVNDLCHRAMNEDGFDVAICINSRNCSIRTKVEGLDLGGMLKKLGFGGGHEKAGAFRLGLNEELSHKIDMLENYLYENFKEIRR